MVLDCQDQEEYVILQLNLNEWNNPKFKSQALKINKVLSYSYKDVNYKPILDMHVRSQSSDEFVDLNLKQIIFIVHLGTLYHWCRPMRKLEKVDECLSSIVEIDETEFMFQKN